MTGSLVGRGLGGADFRRRPAAAGSSRGGPGSPKPTADAASGAPASGPRRLPDPHHEMADQPHTSLTFFEQLARAERERAARLRSLWQLSVPERIAAMRRGELTYEQLAAWSARYPDQVPIVNGEFEWIIAKTPDAAE